MKGPHIQQVFLLPFDVNGLTWTYYVETWWINLWKTQQCN